MGNIYNDDIAVVGHGHDAMGGWQRALKRLFDFVAALVGMVVLSPLFIAIYLMLKIRRRGSAIFSQERIGYGGKPFTIYKFRTMDDNGCTPRLVPAGSADGVGRLGRFLRERHLDELPQLWNVLRGDMSFVGPRPERKYFIDKIMAVDPDYTLIYKMKPGLTSEATLYNGYTDTLEKMIVRLKMDVSYLERRSLWLDFSIIMRTAASMVGGKKF